MEPGGWGGDQFYAWTRAPWEGRRASQFEWPIHGPSKHTESESGDATIRESQKAKMTTNKTTDPLGHKAQGGGANTLETTPKKTREDVLDNQLLDNQNMLALPRMKVDLISVTFVQSLPLRTDTREGGFDDRSSR